MSEEIAFQEIAFHELVVRRILTELSLVDILQTVHNGVPLTKKELLEELEVLVESERKVIEQIGRKNAAKVYGVLEGVSSSKATLEYVLNHDIVGHYRDLIEKEG